MAQGKGRLYKSQLAKQKQTRKFVQQSKSKNLGQQALGQIKRNVNFTVTSKGTVKGRPTSTINTSSSKKVDPRTVTLSPLFIARQQELSNKYGITTFTPKGELSTVPSIESGGFSDIYVGTGKYKTFEEYAQAAINKQTHDSIFNTRSTGGVNVTDTGLIREGSDEIIVSDPSQPARFFNPESKQGSPEFQTQPFEEGDGSSMFSGIRDFLKKNGVYLIVGAAVLVVLSGSSGKRGRR